MSKEGLLRQLVVFSILMENNEGILEKSPSYILEKYYSAMRLVSPETLLDSGNTTKFNNWLKRWLQQ